MKFVFSLLSGLVFAASVGAAQSKTVTVEWEGEKVPQVSLAAQIIYRSPTPQKNDGRSLKLLSAIAGHISTKPAVWDALVAKVRNAQGDVEKLALANRLLNQIPFVNGTDGSWLSPALMMRGKAVCKDFSTGKYLLLKDAGFDVTRLRIISMTPRLDHPEEALHVALVALPAPDSAPVVLDIKPLAERRAMVRKKGNPEAVITDIDPTPGDDPRPLSSYSNRGLLWSGNESGVVSIKP